ncbi:MAG: lipopolysaccharide biosynthesis protein [Alistipes sp.]|nr:lipopolysaccharide biosynthesis protein [Alistipes sp.]
MSTPAINRTTKGILWAAIDKFGIVLLQFVINIVLARLLTPDDFGLVGMIMIFIAVSQTLIDGGFGSALIQKVNASQTDYSTIFYWNILFSCLLYLGIFLAAPWVAEFFRIEALEGLLRVLGVVVIINALTLVQRTILRKAINFRVIAIVDILSCSASAAVAIYMAYRGCGAWSIVGMQLSNALLSTILFWSMSKWRPMLAFSVKSFRSLFSYGGYLLIANIMQDVCTHIQGVVIGRNFSASQTGLYSQAKKMDEVASMTIPSLLCQVLFPLYSEKQNDKEALVDMLRGNMRMISFVIFPLMMLLIIVANPLFVLLYGDKWVDAVPYFQVLCIGGFFSSLYNFNYYAVAAVGRSKALFYWGCYKWGVLLVLLFIGAQISMMGVLVAMVLSCANIYVTNALLAQKYVGYSFKVQITDILPILGCTLVTGAVTYMLYTSFAIHWVVCGLLFVAIYLTMAYILQLRAIKDAGLFLSTFIRKRG